MRFWYRSGAIAWLLWPVSLAFGLVVLLRRILYRLRILKSRHPDIPVIVLSSQPDVKTTVNLFKAGADHYIQKGEGALVQLHKSVYKLYQGFFYTSNPN